LEVLPTGDPRWTTFVVGHRDASPFHHPEWANLIGDCYGYRSFAIAVVDNTGRVTGGLPAIEVKGVARKRRWIALPYTDHCGPLSSDARDVGYLVRHLTALQESDLAPPTEIRAEVRETGVARRTAGLLHTLGLEVRFADSWGTTADTFYRLHVSNRRRLGTPVQPKRYFRLLWERLVEPGFGFVLVAYASDRPAAAAVFLAWNNTMIYKYSASDPKLWKLRPNNLLLWTAIRWGCENGYRTFDFGRTDLDNEGLRAFKRGWGTVERELVYSSIGGAGVETSGGRALKLVRPLIQHMPPWFCRALGEVAYRYAV
jgi:CelD/BcsL family acetyltransferase involved in cellulose biosynthesis